ncbi:MAG: serine protease [Boseongicola sp.]|nr:serine protease [Boseongicola sp.]
MRFLLAVVAAFSVSNSTVAQANTWEDEIRQSIARVVAFGGCPALASNCREDHNSKIGTGFVVFVPSMGRDALLTAYHVVAGSQRFSYKFSELRDGNVVEEAKVLKVNPEFDIALLEIPQALAARVKPLPLAEYLPVKDQPLLVMGYKAKLTELARDTGSATNPTGFRFGTIVESRVERELWDRIRQPSLSLPIVGLDDILSPGDSGAPVFDEVGDVVGMGHGGLPTANGNFSWMLSTQTLIQGISSLEDFSLQSGSSAYAAFNYSSQLFKTGQPVNGTKIGPVARVRFDLRMDSDIPYFSDLDQRLRDYTQRHGIDWINAGGHDGPLGSRKLLVHEPYFPNSGSEPYDCDFRDVEECKRSEQAETALLALLDRTTLHVQCFREQGFLSILTNEGRAIQSDVEISVKFGPFLRSNRDGRLALSYMYGSDFYISTEGFVDVRSGLDTFKLHPDVNTLEQLRGGACRIDVQGPTTRPEFSKLLERSVESHGICFHMILANNTHTPVSLIANLPKAEGAGYLGLWGLLPVVDELGTPDDSYCH